MALLTWSIKSLNGFTNTLSHSLNCCVDKSRLESQLGWTTVSIYCKCDSMNSVPCCYEMIPHMWVALGHMYGM